MRRDLLKMMKCPYCGTDLEVKDVFNEDDKGIINGIIICECDEYPILEGILIIKNSPAKKYSLNYLKNNDIETAVANVFGDINDTYRLMNVIESKPFGKFLKKNLLIITNNSYKEKYKKYSNKDTYFCDILGNRPYEIYLKHRFSSQTFWSLYPFIKLLRNKRKRILDVCSGAGHASFVISNYVKPDELVCVDGDFKSLYLAKKYFSNAEFINIDANYPMPFKDNIFSSIFMMDAFHYVETRSLLANEFGRILDEEGMLLLLHVHNKLAHNVTAGNPVSPSVCKGMFINRDIKVFPEKRIIEDFILNDMLDLSKIYSEEELNLSDAILLISGAEATCYGEIWKDIMTIKDNLIINPIYDIIEKDNKYILERKFPSDFFRKEYPLTEAYIPRICSIDKNWKSLYILDSNKIKIENLMRKFVIINVPKNYSRKEKIQIENIS